MSATEVQSNDLPGDPNCPLCQGVGYLRLDVPVGHPNFGKLQICTCRQANITTVVKDRLYALSHLDELQELTFATFKTRGHGLLAKIQADSIERAYELSANYAESLNGWLVLQGKYGCGKTHLAASIANFAVNMGVPTLFLTVPDLLDTLRFSYDSENVTFEERFNEIRNAKLLVLDDFGTQNATGWAQEKLFQIINYRYINKLSTVITTNISLEEMEPRIRSRLQDTELVKKVLITAPDYRRPHENVRHSELSSLEILGNRAFGNFDLRKNEGLNKEAVESLEMALKTAKLFANNPQGWLILTGDYGSGKTHLAAAIANYRSELGDPPLVVTAADLLDHLRKTFDPKSLVSYDELFEEVKSTYLLIIDDLGTQSMTPWSKEKLHQIFNSRYNAERPTVITIAADGLEELDARLRSRLRDTRVCSIIGITAPPYHGHKAKNIRDKRANYTK